jgi:hypothetical protein
MNRAWIPAGALASVSVAGLIALGPLTDSLGTKVTFSPEVPSAQTTTKAPAAVPVSLSVQRAVGDTQTAAVLERGGEAAAESATNGSDGYVGYRKAVTTTQTTTKSNAPAKPKKTKKVVKRQNSIGTAGETNPDNGLAGGENGPTSLGEQAPTPSSDGG